MNRMGAVTLLLLVASLSAGCASTEGRRGLFLPGYARALAWSPDSKHIIAIRQFDLVVHDAATLKPLVTHKPAEQGLRINVPAASIAYSPDGMTFATAGFDGGVVLWDAGTSQPKARIKDAEGGTTLTFSADGRLLIVAGPDAALMVFDAASHRLLATMVAAPSGIMSVAISPDGRHLATGEINQQVRVWEMAGRTLSAILQGFVGPVLSVGYSPDGKLLATTAGGRETRLMNSDDLTRPHTLVDPAQPTAGQRSAESIAAIVSILGMARTIQLTGAPSGAPVSGFSYPHWPSINCPLTFSRDGKYLALIRFSKELSSDFHVEVYDVTGGARVSRYSGGISSLAFSPDGRRLAVSGILRIIVLDPLTGQEAGVDG